MINKKAQAWGIDLIVAIIIFFAIILVISAYSLNILTSGNQQLQEFFNEGNVVSDILLSDDPPGITTNKMIDQTKLEDFYNAPYSTKKNQMGVKNDFFFTFEDLEIAGNPQEFVGNRNTSDVGNLIKITRVSLYKNKTIQFNVFIWG